MDNKMASEIDEAIHQAAQFISAAILLAGGIIKSDDDVIAQCGAIGMAKEMARRLR